MICCQSPPLSPNLVRIMQETFFPLDTLHSSLCVYLLVRVKRGKEEKKEESEEAMTME